jgi:hypothetical protein
MHKNAEQTEDLLNELIAKYQQTCSGNCSPTL